MMFTWDVIFNSAEKLVYVSLIATQQNVTFPKYRLVGPLKFRVFRIFMHFQNKNDRLKNFSFVPPSQKLRAVQKAVFYK